MTFQTQLGSLHQKTGRVRTLARTVAQSIGGDAALADRAAVLCKCDLLTHLVGEFPELPGPHGPLRPARRRARRSGRGAA